jgi:hypothetical protein
MGYRSGSESVVDPILEDAAISQGRDRKLRHMVKDLAGTERGRELLAGGGQELLALLELLANSHIPQHHGVDDAVALVHLRDRRFGGKLFAILSEAGDFAPFSHPTRGDFRSTEFGDLARVVAAVALRHQHLESLAYDFLGRIAENPFRALVEERDTLKCVHADHRVGGDPHDLGEYVVRYPFRHSASGVPLLGM